MSALVLAVSAGGVVERFGSYAGYASVIGLGVLALLYFTQAREVKRLREWAGRAPERADELEQRLRTDPQRRVVAQPIAPATSAAQNAAAASATAALYASVGATAPGSAPPPGQLARPVPPPSAAAPAAPAAAAGILSPPAGAIPSAAVPAAPTAAPAAPSPSPAGAPPLQPARAAGAPSAPLFGNGSLNQPTRESPPPRPAPLPAPPRQLDEEEEYGVSLARIGLIGGGALAVIAIVVVVVLSMTGKSSPPAPNKVGATPATHSPQKSTSGSLASSPSSTALTSAQKRATNVAVLNGTTQNGLGRAVADTVEAKGFTIAGAAAGTNSDQDIQTTTISYTPGNKEAALEVAKVVQVDRSSVQPAGTTTSAAPDADVVVIVGFDKSG
ncbi:MAG TPA: LytR C-terminal domain-containing protein [Solirubrobacteraceae bacterium]|jgi:hypothetical protein|nr:LytR C-terminal domain-containing protein [Solirubrobacteraceae bacterium]